MNRKSSFLENLLATRWCINNSQEPVEARAARIKSHNALVQTNARWQCYGVREFTTLKSGEHSVSGGGDEDREREREAGVAPRREIFARRNATRERELRSFKSNHKVNPLPPFFFLLLRSFLPLLPFEIVRSSRLQPLIRLLPVCRASLVS